VKQTTVVKSSRELNQFLFVILLIFKVETNFFFEILEVKLAFGKLFASKVADVSEVVLKIGPFLIFFRAGFYT
jgi:hypothetical protein